MYPDPILQSIESAGIATSTLSLSSDRSFSTSTSSTSTSTAPTTIRATTTEDYSAAAAATAERCIGGAPSPFSNSSDSFPGHLPPPPLTALPLHRRRRFSKSSMPAIVKRSASTPNVRGLATADMAALSYAADKRRNKLGYHRTSVACGHCRRRKIRCLLAPEDAQGRCSNCIRLKKECNFFPVEQQPPSESSKHGALKESRGSIGHSSSSSPSPSHPQRSSNHDHVTNFRQYPSGSMTSASQDFPSHHHDAGPRTASMPSMSKPSLLLSSTSSIRPPMPHMQTAPPLPGTVDYARTERPPGWDGSPYLDQSPMSNGPRPILEDPSSSFWRPTESPMTPAFSSIGGLPGIPAIHHRESVSAYPYTVHREDPTWPLQSRSMSFSQLEGMSMNHSSPYPAVTEFKHAPTAHPYSSNYSASHASVPESTSAPSAPPDGRAPNGSFAMPPPWNPSFTGGSLGGMPGKGPDAFGGWYQEPGRLAQVTEEVSTGPLNEEAPAYYHGTAQSTV